MKRYFPLITYLIIITSCTYVAYKSGKDTGSREAMSFAPVLRAGSRFEVYCQLYEHSNQTMNEDTKRLLRAHIEHSGEEFEKQWNHIDHESYFRKYKGLIANAHHYLDKDFK